VCADVLDKKMGEVVSRFIVANRDPIRMMASSKKL
jgi:hypothetical protein